jgi:hypothetical protein
MCAPRIGSNCFERPYILVQRSPEENGDGFLICVLVSQDTAAVAMRKVTGMVPEVVGNRVRLIAFITHHDGGPLQPSLLLRMCIALSWQG